MFYPERKQKHLLFMQLWTWWTKLQRSLLK